MESLLLSTSGQGRRVYLCAVSDGVPLFFKHSELLQTPGYRLLWWGVPGSITENEAAQWVARSAPVPTLYHNYRQDLPPECVATAVESFQSAVQLMSQALEYAPGKTPREVLIGEFWGRPGG